MTTQVVASRAMRIGRAPEIGPGPDARAGIVRRCGRRMTVRYHGRKGRPRPSYVCVSESAESGGAVCQNMPWLRIEEALGGLLLEVMSPIALEMALTVQHEIQDGIEDADRLRRTQVEGPAMQPSWHS